MTRKGDYKPASLISWGQVIDALTEFLGADCPLVEVTPVKGEAFRQSMLAADLRATTIHQRLRHAPMFFGNRPEGAYGVAGCRSVSQRRQREHRRKSCPSVTFWH